MALEFCAFLEAQEGATYEQQLAVAQAAERSGYTGFFRADHLRATKGAGLPGATETWVTLAGIARETSSIRIGSLMNITEFRHPAVLALQVAQVDAMSGGRLELGVGTAWYEPEHPAFGLAFGEVRERVTRLREQLDVLDALWSAEPDSPVDYAGETVAFVGNPDLTRPVAGRVPVIVGGRGGEGEAELAARFGTEFCANFAPPELAASFYDAAAAECGRIGRESATLRRSVIQTILTGPDEASRAQRLSRLSPHSQQMVQNELFGTVDQVVDKLGRYREIGVDRVYLNFPQADDVEYVQWVAQAILGQFPARITSASLAETANKL